MTRPDPHAPTMDNSGHNGGPKDLARTKAGTAQRRAFQEGLGDDSWEDIQLEVDATPPMNHTWPVPRCSCRYCTQEEPVQETAAQEEPRPCGWCAEKELPCPEGHLLHRANLRARAAMTAAVLAFGVLTTAAKDSWRASGEMTEAMRRLRAAGVLDTWPRRLVRWLVSWRKR